MAQREAGWGFFFLMGALFGAVMVLFFGTDDEGNIKEPVRRKVVEGKEQVKEVKAKTVDPVVEVFGEKTKEAKEAFEKATEAMDKKLAAMKKSLEEIDREKYVKLVNEVLAELKKGGDYTATQLRRLKTYFIRDYEEVVAVNDTV